MYIAYDRQHSTPKAMRRQSSVVNFTNTISPFFSFLLFSGDLEIQPAEDMTAVGRIHTNGDMYLAPGGGTTTIRDQPPGVTTVQVSAGGRIYRKRKETGACSGNVSITPRIDNDHNNLLDGPPLPLSCPGSSYISASTIAAYQDAVADQVDSIDVPQPGIIRSRSRQFILGSG